MKGAILDAVIVLLIVGVAIALRKKGGDAQSPTLGSAIPPDESVKPAEASPVPAVKKKTAPDQMGRILRTKFLTEADHYGLQPSAEFPRILGALMDWPIGKETASIISTSTGAASLYTTATFGVLGGEGHEKVRKAAIHFVKSCDAYYDDSQPVSEFPYPAPGRARFYFLTSEGVRTIDADLSEVEQPGGKYAGLFIAAQAVLTELRLTVDK